MIYGDKFQVREVVRLMQRKVCCYDGLFRETPPRFCDCKYGWTNESRTGEQTGCPELRTVVELLGKMTEAEYNKILERT